MDVWILDDHDHPAIEIAQELRNAGFRAVYHPVHSYDEALSVFINTWPTPRIMLLDLSLGTSGQEGRQLAEKITPCWTIIIGHSSEPNQQGLFGPSVKHFIHKGEAQPSDYPAILHKILDDRAG